VALKLPSRSFGLPEMSALATVGRWLIDGCAADHAAGAAAWACGTATDAASRIGNIRASGTGNVAGVMNFSSLRLADEGESFVMAHAIADGHGHVQTACGRVGQL
jgi:hypothetical protein